ncbi:hypothetical protein MM300_13030 [Evansella sp. LMS18]|jgi:hypothetical protein|uniref:DUF6612 family protein n=1 Tax=Evansella sp. LMS18 TaxID=2924033 RepID=UPI0020D13A4A|nr:DUF6612 family protein [Evansella sp. LMS18]UTR08859.1 hypothetical protein MM300_13030 [Evansella sp. LMS18]
MKNLFRVLLAGFIAITLAACGNDDTSTATEHDNNDANGNTPAPQDNNDEVVNSPAPDGNDKNTDTSTSENNNEDDDENSGAANDSSDADLDELLDNMAKAMSEVNSYTQDIQMSVSISSDTNPEENGQYEMTGTSEIIIEPSASYMAMQTTGDIGSMEIETYTEGNTLYTKNPFLGSWMKLEVEEENDDLVENIINLNQFASIIDLETTADTYVLTVSGTGDEVDNFINEWGETFPEMEESEEENVEITSVSFTIEADKKTYLLNKVQMSMEVEETHDGHHYHMITDMAMISTGYNNINEIVIPEDAKNADGLLPDLDFDLPDMDSEEFEEQLEEMMKLFEDEESNE